MANSRLMAHPSRGNCREGRPATARKRTRRSAARCLPERERASPSDQEIERLRRSDEAIAVATGAPRERGCPPWVVLGVKAVEARPPLTFRPKWCWE